MGVIIPILQITSLRLRVNANVLEATRPSGEHGQVLDRALLRAPPSTLVHILQRQYSKRALCPFRRRREASVEVARAQTWRRSRRRAGPPRPVVCSVQEARGLHFS